MCEPHAVWLAPGLPMKPGHIAPSVGPPTPAGAHLLWGLPHPAHRELQRLRGVGGMSVIRSQLGLPKLRTALVCMAPLTLHPSAPLLQVSRMWGVLGLRQKLRLVGGVAGVSGRA